MKPLRAIRSKTAVRLPILFVLGTMLLTGIGMLRRGSVSGSEQRVTDDAMVVNVLLRDTSECSEGFAVGEAPCGAQRAGEARSVSTEGVRVTDDQMAAIRHLTLKEVLPELMTPVGDWRSVMPDQLTICLVPGLELTFHAAKREEGARRNTWIGKNAVQGASLAFCATKELWDAVVTIPGANTYRIHATHQGVTVYELFDDKQACGLADEGSSELGVSASADADSAANELYTVDVLVAYTPGSKTYWGGTPAEVTNAYASVCASINTYYADSRVTNLRLNVVEAVELSGYSNTRGLMDDDLRSISDPEYSGVASRMFDVVNSHREAARADLVQFIVDGERDWAGLAWVNGVQSVVRAAVTPFTMAHEIGHNFGCRHDRWTEKAENDDSTSYHFGHIHEHPMRYGDQTRMEKVGTIMSYASTRIPYFSNPDVSYEGVSIGVAVGRNGAANNAKVLRDAARSMSRIMQGNLLPVITQQPANCAVKTGATLKLGVVASGEDLTYQWYKRVVEGGSAADIAIAGAKGPRYSKACEVTDAAAYFVVVSNASGSVTSSTAMVSLDTGATAADTAASTSSASAGSATSSAASGGGGAVSPLALVLLSLLAAARCGARARR